MPAALAPPVRMEDETFVRAASEPRHVECDRHQAALHVRLRAPAHHLTAEQVNDGGQIHPALVVIRDVGDVTRPDLIGCGPGEVALQQVRRYWQLMFAVRGNQKLAFASGTDTVLLPPRKLPHPALGQRPTCRRSAPTLLVRDQLMLHKCLFGAGGYVVSKNRQPNGNQKNKLVHKIERT